MFCLIFGHRRKYVAIQALGDLLHKHNTNSADHEYCKCVHQVYLDWECEKCKKAADVGQIARWICTSCGTMGEQNIGKKQGVFKVEFGRLVPDEKAWANFK